VLQVISTDDYPIKDRFDAWVDQVARALVPVDVDAVEPLAYQGRMSAAQYGSVGVGWVSSSSCISRRTPRLIRQSDPGAVQLMSVTGGTIGVAQSGRTSRLRPGDLAVHTTWRPNAVHAIADESGLATGTTAVIPRHQIPLSDNALDRMVARRISGGSAVGALLANLLTGLSATLTLPSDDAARLGCALADLLTVTLSTADRRTAPPPEIVHRVLRTAVLDFVHRHLDDHRLNASSVAAAHHVSIRTLNRIFESHGDTVSAFIRRCRFDRCLRDLADPALRHHAIQDITARWFFRSQTHFNRRFREATGMTPGEYRDAALRRPPPDALA
jgi:AraC-like DNA-binding protein